MKKSSCFWMIYCIFAALKVKTNKVLDLKTYNEIEEYKSDVDLLKALRNRAKHITKILNKIERSKK